MTDPLSLLRERVDALQRRERQVARALVMLSLMMLLNSTITLGLAWRLLGTGL